MGLKRVGQLALLLLLCCSALALAQSPRVDPLTVADVAVEVSGTLTESSQARQEILSAYKRISDSIGAVRDAESDAEERGKGADTVRASCEASSVWRAGVRDFVGVLRAHRRSTAVLSGKLLLAAILRHGAEDGAEQRDVSAARVRLLREVQDVRPTPWQALAARLEELSALGWGEGGEDRYHVAKMYEESLALMAGEKELAPQMDREALALLRLRTPLRVSCLLGAANGYFMSAQSKRGEDYDDLEGLRRAKAAFARVLADAELAGDMRQEAVNIDRIIDQLLPIAERNPKLRK